MALWLRICASLVTHASSLLVVVHPCPSLVALPTSVSLAAHPCLLCLRIQPVPQNPGPEVHEALGLEIHEVLGPEIFVLRSLVLRS